MALVLFLLALLVFILFLFQKYREIGKAFRHPPGPSGLPIVGNLHQFFNSAQQRHLWQLSQKYGPLMFIRLGYMPTLVVSSAKMAKEVMKTHDLEFCSRPTFLSQKKLSYNQLDLSFSPYNNYWREMRKICVLHLFTSKRVQSFRFGREEEVYQMIEKFSNLVASSEESKLIINLSEAIMSLTGNIICKVAFGKRCNDEGAEKNRFRNLLIEAQAVMAAFFVSDYFPLMGWVDRVTGMMGRLEKISMDLDLFFQELIDEHLDPRRIKSMQNDDIIDILLRLRNDKLTSVNLSMDHIKALLLDIFSGGTETSAATIVWAMTALVKNPTILKKVQAEVRNLIGKKGMVDEDDIQNLPYFKALIKETLRFYPPVPLMLRQTIQKCVLDGYEIQSKTLVYINAWAIGRDPESWENPEQFSPERFLERDDIDFRGNNFQFIPFGAGRRSCPGLNLGVATVEIALANLLYMFDWELPAGMKKEDIDTDVTPGFVVHKKNALCLVAKNHQF